MDITIGELRAALLWLRNHYDVGDKKYKDLVLSVIDEILMSDDKVNTWVKMKDQIDFRNKFIQPKKRKV
jgi:hypothetical protein